MSFRYLGISVNHSGCCVFFLSNTSNTKLSSKTPKETDEEKPSESENPPSFENLYCYDSWIGTLPFDWRKPRVKKVFICENELGVKNIGKWNPKERNVEGHGKRI